MGKQIVDGQKPKRNEPCPCGNGLKYKHCHGDYVKIAQCEAAYKARMKELIWDELIKKGLMCVHGVKKNEHCKDCKIGD